jgi:hypothetical protein
LSLQQKKTQRGRGEKEREKKRYMRQVKTNYRGQKRQAVQ